MLEFLFTLLLFCFSVCLIPIFLFSYVVLSIGHSLWISGISFLHPEVEFLQHSTIRTLLDTHRNQGIISVLLSVKGQAQPEAVRRYLHELVRRTGKTGDLAFPRLQQCLVTRCGNYAWKRCQFDLDSNVIIAPYTYKGRGVTGYNVQEYVSEYVSKYLPANIPPWQVVIFPSSEDHHYILFKIHHVLISEGLNIGDLLPLIPPTRQHSGIPTYKSPLVNVFKKPKYIPLLQQRLAEDLANTWNEFISNYDPLERTELLKNTPTLLQFQAIVLISLLATFKQCRKGFRVIKDDYYSKSKFILVTLNKETSKRQVTVLNFFRSILATLDPRHLILEGIKTTWFVVTFFIWKLPLMLYLEILALSSCITLQYCPYPKTLTGMLYNYVPLVYGSLQEVFYCFQVIFYAPKIVIQDILLQKETFQTVTLCGRKSVAWSEPIKVDHIRAIAKATDVSETEIMLSASSYTISKFLNTIRHSVPDDLPVTIRNINSNYIFATGMNVRPEGSVSGILCLNLPIYNARKGTGLFDNLMEVKESFNIALEKQGLSRLFTLLQTRFGILTKFLPQVVLNIYLKYLSRKYAISVTEVSSKYPNVTQKTLWGQEVESVIYWRPPQANICISLCVNEYADHIKLGVMCDSQLAPHHPILARGFTEYITELDRITDLVTAAGQEKTYAKHLALDQSSD